MNKSVNDENMNLALKGKENSDEQKGEIFISYIQSVKVDNQSTNIHWMLLTVQAFCWWLQMY